MSKENWEPDILKFDIGAYDAPSYRLEWTDEQLILSRGFSHGCFFEDAVVVPGDEEWVKFWDEMKNIKIWDWASEYTAAVCDGTSWSLEIKYKAQSIVSDGHMAYPDPDNVHKKVEVEYSQPFDRLITALDTLCGKEHFLKY